ncbi:hypothetical protein [Pseudomonas faucium]|uniref:hypothetical protein n=1 Tax=Pseudomonas faucium TaxID=2740518 RepID=UPI0015968568|nr:hypothetical protein [Pseudomonas faucium]
MTKTVEVIMGYVDTPVGVGAAATALTDQYNSDKSGFALVNQSVQTGAAVAGITSIVKLAAGFTPFLNINTNTLAATTVLLKITAQYRTDQTFDEGDILSLVGNVAGVVGGVTLLAGAGRVAGVFTAIGVAANIVGIVNSDTAKNLYQTLVDPILQRHFFENPNATYPDYWVAPDLTLATLAQIHTVYAGKVAVTRWDPDTQNVAIDGDSLHLYEIVGGSGGGYIGVPGVIEGPLVFPLPESPGWSIDIGPLEIIPPGGGLGGTDRYH